MRILGISAFYHDSAAALIEDGRIVAAAQEERFTRRKHDPGFPHHAIAYCLEEAGITADGLDHVVFYDKPFLKFERLLETYVALAPRGFRSFKMSIPLWLKEKLFQKKLLREEIGKFSGDFDIGRLLFCEHHLSHAASAFYPSPHDHAAVLTMDGVGEWATTSAAVGNGNRLEIFQEIHFPHSLGLLYSAATYYTGFKVNSGEYKVMGLAPYGEPRFAKAHSRPPDRSQAGRLVPARHVLFRLLHRLDHDQRAVCEIVRRAGAQPGSVADELSHGRRGLDPGGAGRGGAAADAQPRQADRSEKPLPRRRRGAELRRQRQGAARRPF